MESVSAFYILMMPLQIEQEVCLPKRLQIFSAVIFFYSIFGERFNFLHSHPYWMMLLKDEHLNSFCGIYTWFK